MLAAERRRRILEHLRRDGKVVAAELSEALAVSPDTIRRDLQELAEQLPPELAATVITNCPPIAVALAGHPRVEVTLIGGRLDKHGLVTVGAATVDALRAIRPEICILGICSLDPGAGITVVDAEEA